MTSNKPRVVIVGAGTAGLSAAWSLIRNGVSDVTVLEAQDQTGGRIHTLDTGNVKIDMGASFIGGQGDNPVYNLARRHDLQTDYKAGLTDFDIQFSFSSGQTADEKTAKNFLKKFIFRQYVRQTLSKFGWKFDPKMSLGDYVVDLFEKSFVNKSDSQELASTKKALLGFYQNMVESDGAVDSWQQLSLAGSMVAGDFGGDEFGSLRHGYHSLLDVLLRDMPKSSIKLSHPVSKIAWNESGVTVSTESCTFEADHVIVTAPLGYLREHKESLFEPSLGDKKNEALENIGFGTVGKIILEFDDPFWKAEDRIWFVAMLWRDDDEQLQLEGVPEGVEPWYRTLVGFMALPHIPGVLIGFVGGHNAEVMESRSSEEVGHVCHQLLKKFMGTQDIPEPKNVWKSSWHSNQYFLGAYSSIKVPTMPQIYDDLAAPLPSLQNPRLLFAGEGTERDYHSYVHGALISGEREAQRLLVMYDKAVNHALWKKPSKWNCTVM